MTGFGSIGMGVLVCTFCGGDGKCAECGGTGVNPHLNEDEPNCRNCSGSGGCPGCEGTGRVQTGSQQIQDLGLNSK
jgi:hypothetical protein